MEQRQMSSMIGTIGKHGTIVLPEDLRRRHGLDEGSPFVVEETADSLLVRPANATSPVEIYTPERIAEFLLTSALDDEEYQQVRQEVRDMGLDPDAIPHLKPGE
jgi:AbrB family looped-hinge helix DNA binding protein